MDYFEKDYTKENLSLDSFKDLKNIEKMLYQEFLRREKATNNDEKNISYSNLENIFTNKIYYQAMKDLADDEKKILYFYYYEYKNLKEICKILKNTKDEIIKSKLQAVNHFKNNVEKYQKMYSKKNEGV